MKLNKKIQKVDEVLDIETISEFEQLQLRGGIKQPEVDAGKGAFCNNDDCPDGGWFCNNDVC